MREQALLNIIYVSNNALIIFIFVFIQFKSLQEHIQKCDIYRLF